jgi:hypothetical protein
VEFVLPLSVPAARILRKRAAGEWFFSSDGERPFSTFADLKKEIDKRSGVTGWRLHDIRRSAATLMGDNGVLPHVIEYDVVPGVKGIYQRQNMLDQKRVALDALAEVVLRIVK